MDVSVYFVDTSVLCNLVDVPGRNQKRGEVVRTFRDRCDEGARFVIPVTAVIETGNHIANAAGDRRPAAAKLIEFLDAAMNERSPWQLHAVRWDREFLEALCTGSITGQPLLDILGNASMGTGDVAILCERDQFRQRTRFRTVEIWTLEATLGAYS